MRSRYLGLLVVGLASVPMAANAAYVAVSWNDASVHILDDGFNSVSSFAVGQYYPNGVATDGTTIWVGTFVDGTVRAFDFAGNLLYSWSHDNSGGLDPYHNLNALQGMELVDGKLAIYNDGSDNQVRYFAPATGEVLSGYVQGVWSTEALAYDGNLLWQLADSYIYGSDLSNIASPILIPNAAAACGYQGTGMAYIGAGQLALACTNGDWFTVSTADGSVIDSGNNGLDMFGLAYYASPVPLPAAAWLLLSGIAGLGILGRRRGA